MLCNISQNAMGQTPGGGGGVPCQVQPGGGTLPGPAGGGTLPGPAGGHPARSSRGGTLLRGGTLPGVPSLGGYPGRYAPARSGGGVPS